MTTSSFSFVEYTIEDRIAFITLNRPEKRNAFNAVVVSELKSAFARAAADDSCKVIVLKANGNVFSAGADLAYIQSLQQNSYQENLADSNHLKELYQMIYTLKKVVIAQVEGHAIAGGCGLATVADFSYATEEALFGYTEVKIGFIPAIVMVFLARKIRESDMKRLLLTGDLISAHEAAQIGLITKVVSTKSIENDVRQLATQLCEKTSAQSLELTKKMISEIPEKSLAEAFDYAADMNAKSRANQDCKKGIESFLRKEKMIW